MSARKNILEGESLLANLAGGVVQCDMHLSVVAALSDER